MAILSGMANFQRVGATSNAHAGREFGNVVRVFFATHGVLLEPEFPLELGVTDIKKVHRFDFGSSSPPILVECKSHSWTDGRNAPSAKLTVWNEAMFYFHLAPPKFRKIFVVLRHMKGHLSLGAHYISRFAHLIPSDVEIWEIDADNGSGLQIHKSSR